MREKLLAIAKRIRDRAARHDFNILTPQEVMESIAECIEEELKPNYEYSCTHCPEMYFHSLGDLESHQHTIHGKRLRG